MLLKSLFANLPLVSNFCFSKIITAYLNLYATLSFDPENMESLSFRKYTSPPKIIGKLFQWGGQGEWEGKLEFLTGQGRGGPNYKNLA